MRCPIRTLSPIIAVHLVLLISACGPRPTPIQPPIAKPSASSQPLPTVLPSLQPSTLPVVNPTSNPSAAASASLSLPDGSKLIISLGNRFLTKAGETIQLQTKLIDPMGNELSLSTVRLLFSSSRPNDISIDANGLIVALVDQGFSEISVQIAGSDLKTTQLVSVNSAESYSGGGGGSPQASASPFENVGINVDFEGLDIGEIGVNSDTVGNQRLPVIAMDSDGDFVVAWQNYSGGTSDIFAQRFNRTGDALGSEFLVNTYTDGQQRNLDLAMDADGDFVVTWQSLDTYGYGVVARRYNSSGVAQGSEFTVNTYTSSTQSKPSVAMDADGNFVVTWMSNLQDGDLGGIYAQRFSSQGIAQGTEFLVNTWTTRGQESPTVAMDSDGDFVVAWRSSYQDGDSGEGNIYAQRFNHLGSMLGSEFKVNSYTTDVQYGQEIAMSANGSFVIVWQSRDQDGNFSGIYGQRFNSSGSPQGTEIRINNYTTSSQTNPSVAMDSDGDFVVTWQSYYQEDPSDSTLDEYGVYAQRYSSTGQLSGSEFLVNTQTLDDQFNPAIAMDSDGDFVVSWEGSAQDGDEDGIFAKLFNRLGQAQ